MDNLGGMLEHLGGAKWGQLEWSTQASCRCHIKLGLLLTIKQLRGNKPGYLEWRQGEPHSCDADGAGS